MSNISAPVKLGIIGAGQMGTRHGSHAAYLPGVAVTAIADIVLDKAETLSKNIGGTPYSSVDALLQTDVDAVLVAVPTVDHRAIVEQALAAGKHVLSEKPLALTVADCDLLIQAAAIAEKTLAVGHVVRYFPAYAQAHQKIISGALGKPAAARLRRAVGYPAPTWFSDPAQSGGMILDLLIHDLDFLLWSFGPVVRVHARTLGEKSQPHLDYALITLRHASGVIAHVEGVWGEPGGMHTTFEISGDGGLLTHDSRKEETTRMAIRQEHGGKLSTTAPLTLLDDPYYRQLAAFITSIQTGSAPAVSASEARAAIALALAAQESARSGQVVTLKGETL